VDPRLAGLQHFALGLGKRWKKDWKVLCPEKMLWAGDKSLIVVGSLGSVYSWQRLFLPGDGDLEDTRGLDIERSGLPKGDLDGMTAKAKGFCLGVAGII
jgi:hypothetical protein